MKNCLIEPENASQTNMSMCAFRNPIWVLDLFRYVKPYKKHSTGPNSRILKGFSLYIYIYSLRHFHIQGGTITFSGYLLYVHFNFQETTLLFRLHLILIYLVFLAVLWIHSWSVKISGYTPLRQIIVSLCILDKSLW